MKARRLAYAILNDVINEKQYANLALKQRLQEVDLIDQPLVTSIVYTTLQHQRFLRHLWRKHTVSKPDRRVAVLLDNACAQLVKMDRIPDYAVLNESVELCKEIEKHSVKMVNAVLHKVIENPFEVDPSLDPLEIYAIEKSLPTFVIKLWINHYGEEQMRKIAEALMEPARLCGRINTLKIDLEEVFDSYGVEKGTLSPTAFYMEENLLQSDWFKEGMVWIQDEASQMVSDFVEAKPGMKVLDACSAPGTKAAGIACHMNNEGWIDAVELHEARNRLIEQKMRQLEIDIVHVKTMDARTIHTEFKQDYDRVLCDVPCSGLGVLRRKADIKLRLKPEVLDELQKLQAEILESAQTCLKVDGLLVYSTCTLNRKENEGQIKQFLKNHDNYVLIEEKTIFPDQYGSDGFYMAKLKRNA